MNDPSSPFSTPPPTPPAQAPAPLSSSPPPSAPQPYVPPPLPSPYDNAPKPNTDYISVQGQAQATLILLGVGITIEVVSLFSTLAQISLLSRVKGGGVSEAEINANDIREGIIGIAQLGVVVATAILFLMWMYRAHRNLKALGAQNLEFTSGWAIGYFFVPFINLVRPYQAMVEIWKASDPEIPVGDGLSWKNSPVPALLGWWWGAYLVSNITGQAVMRSAISAETPDALIRSDQITLFSIPFSTISSLLAMALVKAVTERQTAKAARLRNPHIPPNPTPFTF